MVMTLSPYCSAAGRELVSKDASVLILENDIENNTGAVKNPFYNEDELLYQMNKAIDKVLATQSYHEDEEELLEDTSLSVFPNLMEDYDPIDDFSRNPLKYNTNVNLLESSWHRPSLDYQLFCDRLAQERLQLLLQSEKARQQEAASSKAKFQQYYQPKVADVASNLTYPSRDLILTSNTIFIPHGSRFFVIKSFNEQDIISSFTHKVWSSTELGNIRLSKAFKLSKVAHSHSRIFLFFSVNGSGQFCGIAEMKSKFFRKTYTGNSNLWLDNSRYKGQFKIQWLFIKDISNIHFRHLRIPTSEQELKPVTNSRDTQELPWEIGVRMVNIFKEVDSTTSFLQKMVIR